MTVEQGTPIKITEAGNGSKTAFDFPFRIFNSTEINVFKVTPSTSTQVLQTINVDYTVAINGIDNALTTPGGTVTYTVAPTLLENSLIISTYNLDQQTSYPTAGNLPEKAFEDNVDKLTWISKQFDEELGRCLKLPEFDNEVDLVLPSPDAGKALIWDETEQKLINSVSTFDEIVPEAEAARDAAQASALGAASSAESALTSEINAAKSAEDAQAAVGGVRITVNDQKADNLQAKLIPGSGLVSTVNNPGGVETFTLDIDRAGIIEEYDGDPTALPSYLTLCDGKAIRSDLNPRCFTRYSHSHGYGYQDTFPAIALGDNVYVCLTNRTGAVAPADGSTSTGFTFGAFLSVSGSAFSARAIQPFQENGTQFDGYLIIRPDALGAFSTNNSGAGLGGFSQIRTGTANTHALVTVALKNPPSASQSFSLGGGTNYYYTVGGAGSGSGVEIRLPSAPSYKLVQLITMAQIAGFPSYEIQCIAASGITAGSFFTFGNATEEYGVWFTIDGAGTEPVMGGRTPIHCPLLSTDTAAQVATKVSDCMRNYFFAVPDRRELFARGWASGSSFFYPHAEAPANYPGFVQRDVIGTHIHSVPPHTHPFNSRDLVGGGSTVQGGSSFDLPVTGSNTGLSASINTSATGNAEETRSVNSPTFYVLNLG